VKNARFTNSPTKLNDIAMRTPLLFSTALSLGFCLATYAVPTPPINTEPGPAVSPSLKDTGRSLKRKVAIARFTNETTYGRSFLVDKDTNPIGKQAVDILSKKLLDTNKFILLERADLEKVNAELGIGSAGVLKNMADYLVVGSITAFGRKTEGKVGVFTRKKRQVAFAKVNLRLIDVQSGLVIYAEEGSGEAFSEQKTAMGLGPRADYDSTLNDQVLDAAISNLASKVIENLLGKPWRAYILAFSDGNYVITGGKSQGLSVGDTFDAFIEGKKVRNPQTGMEVALPGKKVGQIRIDAFAGDTLNEVAVASVTSGELPRSDNPEIFKDYFIQEAK
jgi:curli biogenesis system outer membrane secretion channel CsgG